MCIQASDSRSATIISTQYLRQENPESNYGREDALSPIEPRQLNNFFNACIGQGTLGKKFSKHSN
jgi:hypothetical protein